jgi:lantibiotic modifying enzyme
MGRHTITRRELLGMGLGAAAGMIVLPSMLSARGIGTSPMAPPIDGLDVALKAAKWIRRSRIETKNGVTWPADPLKPASVGLDLYNGMPGIILFHLELFHATGDKTWLDDARLGANELIAQLPVLQAAERSGLYDGLAGAAFVLEETHRATGDGTYRDAVTQAIATIHQLAKKTSSGAEWGGGSATNDIVSGGAGIGLFLSWAAQEVDDPPSRGLALLAGRHLMDVGVPDKAGDKWPVANGDKTFYPNFAHGTAGVGFFLAKLFATAVDRSMYGGSLTATRYLEAVASTEGGGFKIFHHEPGGENLYYMGWDHGPAGTARLFAQLGQIARPDHWNGVVDQCAHAIIAAGVPEKQSPGFWNNVGQCSGNAGIGDFFVTLQQSAPNPAYADMVQRISAATLARATVDGDGLKWIQAENRESPDALVAQTGFMQGAAGIGTYFLHADGLAKGRKRVIKWPDAATTGRCEVSADVKAARDMSSLPGGPEPRC